MKKVIILMGVLMMFVLIGCKANVGTENTTVDKTNETIDNESSEEDIEKNPAANLKLEGFKVKDIEGNDVDESIFKDKDLTVVNLWGTLCSPCIEEMPEFEEISKEFKDKNVQFIGIVADKEEEDAKKILEELGVTYKNIIPDEKIEKDLLSLFDYVPATLFVNSEGEILETFIPGGTDKETLKSIIEKLL